MAGEEVDGRDGAARHAVADDPGGRLPERAERPATDDRSLVDRLLAADEQVFDWGWGDPAASHDIPELWGPDRRTASGEQENAVPDPDDAVSTVPGASSGGTSPARSGFTIFDDLVADGPGDAGGPAAQDGAAPDGARDDRPSTGWIPGATADAREDSQDGEEDEPVEDAPCDAPDQGSRDLEARDADAHDRDLPEPHRQDGDLWHGDLWNEHRRAVEPQRVGDLGDTDPAETREVEIRDVELRDAEIEHAEIEHAEIRDADRPDEDRRDGGPREAGPRDDEAWPVAVRALDPPDTGPFGRGVPEEDGFGLFGGSVRDGDLRDRDLRDRDPWYGGRNGHASSPRDAPDGGTDGRGPFGDVPVVRPPGGGAPGWGAAPGGGPVDGGLLGSGPNGSGPNGSGPNGSGPNRSGLNGSGASGSPEAVGAPDDLGPDPTTVLDIVSRDGGAATADRGTSAVPRTPESDGAALRLEEYSARRRATEQAAAAAEAAAAAAAERASSAIAAAARAADEAEAAAEAAARAAEEAEVAAAAEARAIADAPGGGGIPGRHDGPGDLAGPDPAGPDPAESPTQAVPLVAPVRPPGGRPPVRPAGPPPRGLRPDDIAPPGPPRGRAAHRAGSPRDEGDAEATEVMSGLRALRAPERPRPPEPPSAAEVTTVAPPLPAEADGRGDDVDAERDHAPDGSSGGTEPDDGEETEARSRGGWLTRRSVLAGGAVAVVLAVAAVVTTLTTTGAVTTPAAVTAAAVPPPVEPAPAVPQPGIDPESEEAVAYLTALRDADVPTSRSGQAETEAAAAICSQLDQGADEAQLERSVPAVLPDVDRDQAGDVVDLAQEHYC